jgi:hypothetical protein
MNFIFLFISDELILLINIKLKKLWNKQTMAVKPQKDRYF